MRGNPTRIGVQASPALPGSGFLCLALSCALLIVCPLSGSEPVRGEEPKRAAFWLDLLTAEPAQEDDLWEDLAAVDVVFVGETHRLKRHHQLQREILARLLASGRPLVLGLEQIERRNQPELDRLNRGEIDFNTFAERIRWGEQWQNYEDYRELILSAIGGGARVVGLNAPREVIRQVGRLGVAALPDGERASLPEVLHLDDPLYERLMNQLLQVHAAFDPKFLRNVFEAQAARDETMAEALGAALANRKSAEGKPPLAVAITGSGHIRYGLGTPDRFLWRNPGLLARIVLLSESGDLVLTPTEQAMSREIEIRHRDLMYIRRPVGDYLHVQESKPRVRGEP